jgi:hypothetical protein
MVLRALSKYWIGKYAMHASQMGGASHGPMLVLSLETVVIISLDYLCLLSASKSSCSSQVLSFLLNFPVSFASQLSICCRFNAHTVPTSFHSLRACLEKPRHSLLPTFLFRSLSLLLLEQ